jgi:hypothetical protein
MLKFSATDVIKGSQNNNGFSDTVALWDALKTSNTTTPSGSQPNSKSDGVTEGGPRLFAVFFAVAVSLYLAFWFKNGHLSVNEHEHYCCFVCFVTVESMFSAFTALSYANAVYLNILNVAYIFLCASDGEPCLPINDSPVISILTAWQSHVTIMLSHSDLDKNQSNHPNFCALLIWEHNHHRDNLDQVLIHFLYQ